MAVLGGLGSALRRSAALLAIVLVFSGAFGGAALRAWQLTSGEIGALARSQSIVDVRITLNGTARLLDAKGPSRPGMWMSGATVVALATETGELSMAVPIEVSAVGEPLAAWTSLAPGTTVSTVGRLRSSAADSGVAAQLRIRSPPREVVPPGPVDAAVARVRAGLREACAELPADARALVPALVVGDTASVDEATADAFKATGLTHLTAVSGANLVLLLAFVRGLAVALGLRGRWVTVVLVVTVACFVALCMSEPSVVRAAAMGLVGLAALGAAGRGRQGLRSLAVAVWFLVLWDPWLARSVGFALSVTASAGLLLWAGRWAEAMARWAPRWLAEAVTVPLAAQLATQPIVTAISGQVSLVGILANAAASPLVGPATVCGFAAAGLAQVWLPLGALAAWPAGWCALALCWIARAGALLPGAVLRWPTGWQGVVVVAVACAGIVALTRGVLTRPWVVLAIAIAVIGALARVPVAPGWPPAAWSVLSCDVGQGDATLIRAGPGTAVLVDAGPDPAALRACLAQSGIFQVPLVVLTHLHADHVSGLPAVQGMGVQRIATSTVSSPASGDAIVDGLESTGVPHARVGAGATWLVGEARVEVLSAAPLAAAVAADEDSAAENDASLVLRATVDGVTVLLCGDVEEAGQAAAKAAGPSLDADVLLVPHHGSGHQDPSFLAMSTPAVAVISVGADNDYGHPTAKTLQAAGSLTASLFRTDEDGHVAVGRAADGSLLVTTQR